MKYKKINIIVVVGLLILYLSCNIIYGQQRQSSIGIHINLKGSLGSTERLKDLLNGVGYDCSPDPELLGPLQKLGIKRVRLINVDNGNTSIQGNKLHAPDLEKQLDWCQKLGAQPHIIIGQGIPLWLSTYKNDPKFGPLDWILYQDYLKLFFKHVIFEKGFRIATWEVANEPDAKGAPVPKYPRTSKWASEEEYQAYFQLYRNVAVVAAQLEKEYSDVKILLGGPASCGPIIDKPYDFNWHRFLKDVVENDLKLDFFSFHFYGNQSSIGDRPNLTVYPTFKYAMKSLRDWINTYKPGLPIWITEWGPSYITEMDPAGIINGNHIGAAWSAAFVYDMLQTQVDRAIFLVTSDLQENWAWPALFHGKSPKPIYYVFDMFNKFQGEMLEVKGGSPAIGAMAAKNSNQLVVMIWNYNWLRGDKDKGRENAQQEQISITITGLPFDQSQYRITKRLISEMYGNPYHLTLGEKEGSPHPLISQEEKPVKQKGMLDLDIFVPPSSVTLLEISPTTSDKKNPVIN